MLTKQLELTNEQTSPLFRIMWIYNADEPARRQFENNICAFHIGNGLILSVAHNLKTEAKILKSIDGSLFSDSILPFLNPEQVLLFKKCYSVDAATNKRYLNTSDQNDLQMIGAVLQQLNFDTRWVTLSEKKSCLPHLIVQFKDDQFYNDAHLTSHFNSTTYFHEPTLNRHTFLLEVELVEAFYQEDIALYKIINTHQNIIDRLPAIEINFSILNDAQKNYYCLQSSPGGSLGRLLNKAQIEGYLDHHATFADRFGGDFTFEGMRYLIQGYFRFGSSGAPYVVFDNNSGNFKVNAIQSEACPIQLSISNNKEGNFQYVNALATPLSIIQSRLQSYLSLDTSSNKEKEL
jgi:hypothetical protein